MQRLDPIWLEKSSAHGAAVRVLLWLETGGRWKDGVCACCGSLHKRTCPLDAALTRNGLRSYSDRVAARVALKDFDRE